MPTAIAILTFFKKKVALAAILWPSWSCVVGVLPRCGAYWLSVTPAQQKQTQTTQMLAIPALELRQPNLDFIIKKQQPVSLPTESHELKTHHTNRHHLGHVSKWTGNAVSFGLSAHDTCLCLGWATVLNWAQDYLASSNWSCYRRTHFPHLQTADGWAVFLPSHPVTHWLNSFPSRFS